MKFNPNSFPEINLAEFISRFRVSQFAEVFCFSEDFYIVAGFLNLATGLSITEFDSHDTKFYQFILDESDRIRVWTECGEAFNVPDENRDVVTYGQFFCKANLSDGSVKFTLYDLTPQIISAFGTSFTRKPSEDR